MSLEPGVRVEDMRGDLVQLGGQRPPYVEFVRPAVRGQGGIQAVREQFRGAGPLRPVTAWSANWTARAGWPA
ncbi:MAG: hypothetical protein ABJB47_19110 [Actinomycetota bacterium]